MSKIEVNTVDVQCGSTLTLGSSGKTVTLASGASQSGFGRTGTVDWCTTAKTSPFTSVSGKGYFVNTTSGAVTVTLPASPSGGDIVSIADYTNTFQTNKVTLARNGSKIGGVCANASLSTEGQSATFVYVDGTEGWKNVQDSTSNVVGESFISASGGTETTCGNFKIHTFNADGCFAVSSLSSIPANNEVSYIVVGGGGGSGSSGGNSAGGGGAGGFRESKSGVDSYTASPLEGSTNITVTATTFPITVGAGGGGAPGAPGPAPETPGTVGNASTFSTVSSAGGGFGAGPAAPGAGGSGGSGGGGGGGGISRAGGSGNTPSVTPAQGKDGGTSSSSPPSDTQGGGGGGATVAGSPGLGAAPFSGSGNGGAGATTSITGSPTAYAGGGGGGVYSHPSVPGATGGLGGTGGGGPGGRPTPAAGVNGTANTGGGAGGPSSGGSFAGATGGSGVVIIRYKFQ